MSKHNDINTLKRLALGKSPHVQAALEKAIYLMEHDAQPVIRCRECYWKNGIEYHPFDDQDHVYIECCHKAHNVDALHPVD